MQRRDFHKQGGGAITASSVTGEINYRNVFHHVHQKGYGGVVGMEHGSSKPGRDGEQAVIDAYVATDAF